MQEAKRALISIGVVGLEGEGEGEGGVEAEVKYEAQLALDVGLLLGCSHGFGDERSGCDFSRGSSSWYKESG